MTDSSYFLWASILFVFALLTQRLVYLLFALFKNKPAISGITPQQFAKIVIDKENAPEDIQIIAGKLSDYYDSKDRIVRLSESTANHIGLSALGITAHELGHALQHRDATFLFTIRNWIAGFMNIITYGGYILFIAGMLLSILELSWLGLILFATSTLFYLVTFPLELDASYRGLKLLRKYKVVQGSENFPIVLILGAAALTYLLTLLQSLLQLFRFISILRRR